MLTPFTAKEPKIFFFDGLGTPFSFVQFIFQFCIFMRRFKLVLFDVFQNLILVYVYGNLPIYDDSTKPSFHSRRTPICMFSAGIHIQLVSIHDYSFLFWVTACIGYSHSYVSPYTNVFGNPLGRVFHLVIIQSFRVCRYMSKLTPTFTTGRPHGGKRLG